jgi:hypothetical protein
MGLIAGPMKDVKDLQPFTIPSVVDQIFSCRKAPHPRSKLVAIVANLRMSGQEVEVSLDLV